MISKYAMSEFSHNLSMHALSKSDDTIVIKFNVVNVSNKSLNYFLNVEVLAFDTAKVSRIIAIFNKRI